MHDIRQPGGRKASRIAVPLILALLIGLLAPPSALAIQTHGPLEGLVVHQIGHFLYGLAMLGFSLRIRRSHLSRRPSWRLMAAGSLLLALWNGWAFVAHILNRTVPADHFLVSPAGVRTGLEISTPVDALFYLFKMDHLLSVPALVLIYLALSAMNRDLTSRKQEE